MSTPINDGGPACRWCNSAAVIRQGRIDLCAKHYRFQTMRTRARRDGKTVPSYNDLDDLIPAGMTCQCCKRGMNWRQSEGASTVITLQHDRDGALRLICLGCNTRHSVHEGDSFYVIPADMKFCPDCRMNLPIGSFSIDRSRPIGRKSYCRPCSAKRNANWRTSYAIA